MIRKKPTQDQINKVIEAYHKFPDKKITLNMLKLARDLTGLGLFECKLILEDYIDKTYK